jgi:hypothetical protein
MAHFQTKNSDLSKFWGVLHRKVLVHILCVHLVYFMAIWYILWSFGIFKVNWYIFTRLGMLHKEKSGNPGL